MISGLKVLVDDESSVVDEPIIVNRLENIVVDISVSASDQNAALDFQFILFAFFLPPCIFACTAREDGARAGGVT
jgi:hypothetical protein